jgi:CheY-like chemotaxis protein
VSDSGIGIAPKQLPRIFEALDQEGSALNRAQAGHGVGLFLAKGLVELHGGTISARSRGAGQGSEFEIRLSLASPGALRGSPGPAAAPAAPDEQKFRILIADDVRDIADSLALLLEDMGHEVHVAYDGEQALRMAQDLLPHVVLLDLGMPKVHGYDVCRALRAAPWGVDMTVIAQTGWGQENDRRLTLEAGFDHHVTKPVQADALVALFRRFG